MRITLTLIFLLTASCLLGQSDSLEIATILKKLSDKQISQEEFSRTSRAWNNTIKEFGEYPELPINKNGYVSYSFIIDVPGISKQVLFPRFLEWLAINYGLFPAYYYSSQDDGKIIFQNRFNINGNNSCSFVAVILVTDGKALVEFINIFHHNYMPGRYVGEVWVPEWTIDTGLEKMYPVITRKSSEWNEVLSQLKLIDTYFETAVNEFYSYVGRSD